MPKKRCVLQTDDRAREEAARSVAEIQDAFPKGVSKPALRALARAGYSTIEELSDVSEAELALLHGMGPNALAKLRNRLAELGMSFAE